MLLIASCVALTVLAGVFVFLPLFRESGNSLDIELTAETEPERLADRKTAIYGNLSDLAFEYQMGRLSDEDFRQLEAGYKTDAAAILHKLEQLGVSEHLDEAIEKDIASRRNVESAGASESPGNKAQCPACGADIIPGKKFCADCGHEL